MKSEDAFFNLVDFIQNNRDGFNLLIFVCEAGRITKTDESNWLLFVEYIIKKGCPDLPIALAFTHTEHYNDMDYWYKTNQWIIKNHYKMSHNVGFGIVGLEESALAGLEDKIIQSKAKIWKIIDNYSSEKKIVFFSNSGGEMWKAIITIWNLFCKLIKAKSLMSVNMSFVEALIKTFHIAREKAIELADKYGFY